MPLLPPKYVYLYAAQILGAHLCNQVLGSFPIFEHPKSYVHVIRRGPSVDAQHQTCNQTIGQRCFTIGRWPATPDPWRCDWKDWSSWGMISLSWLRISRVLSQEVGPSGIEPHCSSNRKVPGVFSWWFVHNICKRKTVLFPLEKIKTVGILWQYQYINTNLHDNQWLSVAPNNEEPNSKSLFS